MGTFGFVVILVALVVVLTMPLGRYLAGVITGERTFGERVWAPVERLVYRLSGVDPSGEQRWTVYAASVVAFGLVSVAALYSLLRLQGVLPLNPTGMPAVPPALAFNTAISFATNTNWQNYGGEATLGHLSQMVGLGVQNFVSAAAGFGVLAALARGLSRAKGSTLGSFWVDVTRFTVRVALPLSLVFAVALVSQGVVQNFDGFREVATIEGGTQVVPGGPAASQIAIKQLGTNGGGFFNVNSAHPLENPTGVSNLLQTLAIVLIPFASVDAFGRIVGNRRNARAILAVMAILWLASMAATVGAETAGNPLLTGTDQAVTASSPGGNMEGKEVRFGPGRSAVWAASTTATSNGSVNAMHDSLSPVGGLVTMVNMLLGELSPGGVGVGLTGMLVYVIFTVFIAGLMVGRTPEYLGKKIQAAEMKLATTYILAVPVVLLGFAGASIYVPGAVDSTSNPGAHGFSELLYAYASTANNNGSAFAGFGSNTAWYNVTQGLAMLVGRFFLMVPVLAIAGSLVAKPTVPAGDGTFPTHTPLFAGLLTGVILILAGLTFFPALALGPIVEALR
jgi:potassium-transporting ATPase potassium-binding subunit